MKKSWKYVGILILIPLLIITLSKVFSFKYEDGIGNLKTFYQQEENTVDVLVLGSSHAYMNIDPSVLFKEQGISSFALGSAGQSLWNSYIYLKEAIRTQDLDLIVLEGYILSKDMEYLSGEEYIHKAISGIENIANKKEAIELSVPKDERLAAWFPSFQAHNRYTDLTNLDFETLWSKDSTKEHWKGFMPQVEYAPEKRPPVEMWKETQELHPKIETYYRKILELAEQEEIPILVMIAPYDVEEWVTKRFNKAEEIAGEYEVPFLNLNLYYDEMGIDFETDITADRHLTYVGAEKASSFFGQYLKENYELEDHRGDEKYSSWQKEAEYQEQWKLNLELQQCEEISAYMNMLQNPNYKIVVSTAGEYLSEAYLEEMELIGIDSLLYAAGGAFILQNGQILHYSGTNEDYFYHEEWGDSDIALKKTLDVSTTGEERPAYEMMLDLVEYRVVGNGINILVWDELSQSVVDAVGFYAYNGWEFNRK